MRGIKNCFIFPNYLGQNKTSLTFKLLKTSQKVLLLFLVLGMLFIIGSIFRIGILTTIATYLMIPTLILYYRYRTKKWFFAMVFALLLLYIRDILMLDGFNKHALWITLTFALAILIIYGFALTSIQKSRILVVEVISLIIMYGFLGFLFYSMADLVPQVLPSFKIPAYFYLGMLTLLLGLTFTQYLLKSHYASLWLMLGAASLLVSELSLFFKMFVISDISVNIFFPLFHVISFYAFVEHAVNRRPTSRIPGF